MKILDANIKVFDPIYEDFGCRHCNFQPSLSRFSTPTLGFLTPCLKIPDADIKTFCMKIVMMMMMMM
eukprot:12421418-Karenia_brevis.AAC.1